MDLLDRAEQIARKAIAASGKYKLRQPPVEQVEKTKSDCIVEIATLFAKGFTLDQASLHAALATYRAVEAEAGAARLGQHIARMLDALDLAETAVTGTPEQAREALAALSKQRATLISTAVEMGQSINAKQRAVAAGKARQAPNAQLRAFAIEQFEGGRWKSTRQAGASLWPLVQAKAQEIGYPLTPTQGPTTLYQWLLAHNKTTRSAG